MPERPETVSGVIVIAPGPLLTVTVEAAANGEEVHLHAGGQGVWVARMARALGADVTLLATFGGESGQVVRSLLEGEGFAIACTDVSVSNGVYVHDRRSGERRVIAAVASAPLSRHDLDAFYGAVLVEAGAGTVAVLGGPDEDRLLPSETYRRWAHDLREQGATVVADLSGERLQAAVAGGVDVVKVSSEELVRDGLSAHDELVSHLDAMAVLQRSGAGAVVVSRADEPTVARYDDRTVVVRSPVFEPRDPRGGGDSLTAGIATALARGESMADALALGSAAASLNVTRGGLATGEREQIEALVERVTVREVDATGDEAGPDEITTPDELAQKVQLP